MKKLFICLLFIYSVFFCFSQKKFPDKDHYEEYTLENGMHIFVLEDFSSATVRIEYAVQAGFSSQTAADTGFFTLYSRLFKKNTDKELGNTTILAECGSDSSSYKINIPPTLVKKTLTVISQNAFSPSFSDQLIREELSALKTEIMQYAYTPAAFINAGIDSRVFSAAPWKQDSGIYPAIFAKISPEQARNIIAKISRFWYTPQNSALFISGGISRQDALHLAELTFGIHPHAINPKKSQISAAGGKQRKFVIHDPQLSDELTQIVIQYTSFPFYKSDLAAAVLNQPESSIKNSLCSEDVLNIRDGEYIHAAAVHMNGNSRLIIQSLMEKNGHSPAEQSNIFIKKLIEGASLTQEQEFFIAKKYLTSEFLAQTSNSESFMSFLAKFWAIDNLSKNSAEETSLPLAEYALMQPELITNEDTSGIADLYATEKPFIFVIVSTRTYNKYKTSFARSGYEQITQKNSSWYMQNLQQNASRQLKEESEISDQNFNAEITCNQFIEYAQKNIETVTLKNKIPVCLKTNQNSTGCTIVVAINGGKLADGKKSGFQSVMTKSIASNIERELFKCAQNSILESLPKISTKSENSQTFIIVECSSEDAGTCAKTIGNALIFGELVPSDADGHVYSIQTEKRLYDANPVNQMYFRGIKYLYDNISYRNIFDSENSILTDTKYTDLLAAYPAFLNADRYKIVVSGNFNRQVILTSLKDSIELLSSQKNTGANPIPPVPDFPSKSKRINLKIRHLFYTDVKAEEAGPMPAVLVPTKEFLDPVQYWIKSPEPETKEFILFNALLLRLKELPECAGKVRVLLPCKEIHAAAITFLNVQKTSYADEAYKNSVDYLKDNLKNSVQSEECELIKSAWIQNVLEETKSNRGTALIIAAGTEFDSYIKEYKCLMNATKEEIRETAEKYLPSEAFLRIYSADSKK
ncbi:MAG: hypothetical protein II098_03660 [Treponema sp.]|nr:hypothetical protein [Treponema sp.]